MGAYFMEASQINYRKGGTKMSVEQALQNAKGGYDYSTDEYSTNSKWTDGSEIFGKVIPLSAGDLGSTTSKESGLTNVEIISMKGFCKGVGATSMNAGAPLPNQDGYYAQTTVGLAYNYDTNSILIHPNNNKMATWTGYIELQYIKVTPPATPES